MSTKIDDSIPVFLPHQNHFTDLPAFFLPRSEARKLKKTGEGYFQRSGRVFTLVSSRPTDWEELARRYEFRDESACIQEPTMFAFVLGERRAIAAVNAWN